MSYYENQTQGQWPAPNNNPPQQTSQSSAWDHQTPPARSGASSAIPRDEAPAFVHQMEEVDRAIDNLMKSGKMFMGGRGFGRGGPQVSAPGNMRTQFSMGPEFGQDPRQHPQSNLQNYYASQRNQSSRGSNEAESMIQAKRRMAAARERELRNYHQEQQYNRTVLGDAPGAAFPGRGANRTLSPGGMSEDERRELIARQRSALYGEGPFAETGGYVDETGVTRPGVPAPAAPTPSSLRGASPLAYEYGRVPQGDGTSTGTDPNRATSNSSPHSNAPSSRAVFDPSQRTSNSSPGGSPPHTGPAGAPIGTKPNQPPSLVAPIGTRPGAGPASAVQASSAKRATPPLASPLGRVGEDGTPVGGVGPSNPSSASADAPVGLGGWSRGGWGGKSGLQTSTSVWG